MITMIGGINQSARDNITGEPTALTTKVQPFKSWNYLDLKEKKMKWGKDMPFGRTNHCVVKYNESTALIFGGAEIAGINGEGYTGTKYNMLKAYMKELRSGFFMHFPDPDQPNKYVIEEVFLFYVTMYWNSS